MKGTNDCGAGCDYLRGGASEFLLGCDGQRKSDLPLFFSLLLAQPHSLLVEERRLGGCVSGVAREEDVVTGGHAPCKAHKHGRVAHEGEGHLGADSLHGLLHVSDGGQNEAPVGDGGPEVDGAGSDGRSGKGAEVEAAHVFVL